MKQLKDLTIEDLLAEGRRWVPFPGELVEGGFRLEIVFHDHPCRFCLGQVSNDPSLPPPLIVSSDSPHSWCVQWAIENGMVKNGLEYLSIVGSSISAQDRAMDVHVLGENADLLILRDGFGNVIHLDEDNAVKLYQRLAVATGMPHQVYCPNCEEPLMDYESCPCQSHNTSRKKKES